MHDQPPHVVDRRLVVTAIADDAEKHTPQQQRHRDGVGQGEIEIEIDEQHHQHDHHDHRHWAELGAIEIDDWVGWAETEIGIDEHHRRRYHPHHHHHHHCRHRKCVE
jgi:hypothetical protein